MSQVRMTPVGLEPTIPGSVGRCLIHWATGPVGARPRISDFEMTYLGGHNDRTVGLEPVIPGSEGRRLVHWARGPLAERFQDSYTLVVIHLGGGSDRRCGSPPCWGVEGDNLFKVLLKLSHWRLQTTLLEIPDTSRDVIWF